MPKFANFVELLGGVSVVVGCWLLAPWLAFIVGGMVLVVAATAIEGADE